MVHHASAFDELEALELSDVDLLLPLSVEEDLVHHASGAMFLRVLATRDIIYPCAEMYDGGVLWLITRE